MWKQREQYDGQVSNHGEMDIPSKLDYDGKGVIYSWSTHQPVISKAYANKHASLVLIKRDLRERAAS